MPWKLFTTAAVGLKDASWRCWPMLSASSGAATVPPDVKSLGMGASYSIFSNPVSESVANAFWACAGAATGAIGITATDAKIRNFTRYAPSPTPPRAGASQTHQSKCGQNPVVLKSHTLR